MINIVCYGLNIVRFPDELTVALRQAITAGKYLHIQTMLTYLTFARKSSNNKS
jgi:hypothetical protein